MKKRVLLATAVLAWAAVIFLLCTLPSSSIPKPGWEIPHADKIAHFGLHFVMAYLLIRLLRAIGIHHEWAAAIIATCFCILYGGLIEILQMNYFQRSGDPLDELANLLGACAGCLLSAFLHRHRSPVRANQPPRQTSAGDPSRK